MASIESPVAKRSQSLPQPLSSQPRMSGDPGNEFQTDQPAVNSLQPVLFADMPNKAVYSRNLIGCTIKDPTITVERSPRGLYISARFRLQISVNETNLSAQSNRQSEVTDLVNKHIYPRHAHFLHEIQLEYSKKGFEDIITTYFPEQISTAEVRRTVQTRRGREVGGEGGVAGSVPAGTIRFTVTRDTTIAQEMVSPAWVLSDSETFRISTLSFNMITR
jgi:hypothetical protein